jgi:heme-degrading monooxygenase HmoA
VIIENAEFSIIEGREEEFEVVMRKARAVVAASPGFISIDLARGVERPSVYLVRIAWRTVENHTKDFRESDLYLQWSELVRPFWSAPAKVEHWDLKMNPFRG